VRELAVRHHDDTQALFVGIHALSLSYHAHVSSYSPFLHLLPFLHFR
jgi:hypothetical protein